jgi:hypothetical protein
MKFRSCALIVVVVILALCGAGAVFWDGYWLPGKPCRPIRYPTGETLTNSESVDSSRTFEEVMRFYDSRLSIGQPGSQSKLWTKELLSKSTTLYSCYAGDINGLTAETGCIIVNQVSSGTQIVTLLLRGEGSSPPCPVP